ncbi:diadenosine tetraphosphate (Ap4A) HIT family hydrolase [Krasilnikovia cinnamomea]|uniref:Diadenosine tetraphosphate (Ap4A) HIT family hydrolase n=1 Tax=Krasilnikovia cinnamomea TaxID=349313 RepID=A0A4V2G791_9ACTN|nr:HIT domain-containing protein [Krasilnikovia cinnamomea]RZU51666.1 diadenosine tetraphosphate (Ap4A) HIT family hydrolase [Krasilnikovia cinnamomea]
MADRLGRARRGTVCRLCAEGRPDESRTGARIYAGAHTDAYLARKALVRGYVVVIWRGRHAVEPHHLSADEAASYHADVLRVGRLVDDYFQPMKINYMTMGNRGPHLHTHVTARYLDDPAPGAPLPDGPNMPLPENQWRADVAALRRLVAEG